MAEPQLPLTPGSIVWQHASDARLLLTAGYALLLQVAHPTVGMGVMEHSVFRADPWGRLERTLDAFYGLVYGGPEAAAIGRRLRELHRTIRGPGYHALEPEAYAWVHASLAETVIRGHALLGRSLDQARFWEEWRALGRLLGIRRQDLPADLAAYVEHMVGDRLERTAAVDAVLDTLRDPGAPPLPLPLRAGWPLAGIPLARAHMLVTVGMLPPVLRERFGLRWGRVQQLELELLARTLRATTPVLPGRARTFGPTYLWLRR